ncbi:MAG: nucleotidyl transferase AbiEii/AbiGii toxin family protein [Gemmatimonadales bacterium]|nr:nucleotidyl transferase AbiEii/AbiGii toxin family protein [Gemmatimonadales bacterium]
MTDASLISLFVRPLNQLRIPYLVTGGVASVVYGEPRFTRDIDLVIELRPRDARRFAAAWSPEEFYVPPVEVIEEESGRPAHGHFNVIHHQTAMRADVYLAGGDALNAWSFAHKVVRRIDDDEVFLAPIEAVMLSKLRYYQMGKSDRHLRDVNQMLRISGDLVNRPELERWAARLGVEGEWKQAQDFQKP